MRPLPALHRDLARALRTGPFSAALHLAIEARGLRLDEVHDRLGAEGVMVSLATLSYWRRGHRRPEGADSVRAVSALEHILELPEGALSSQLVSPQRARRRTPFETAETGISNLWARPESIIGLLSDLDSLRRSQIETMSLHEIYFVGPDRQESAMTVRQVFRVKEDNVTSSTVIYCQDDVSAPPPVFTAIRGCRTGRVRNDRATGAAAVEFIFDRVLNAGDMAAVEYHISLASTVPAVDYHRNMPTDVSLYVLEVQFSSRALPARCFRYEKRSESAPPQGKRELWIGSAASATTIVTDARAGVVGVCWEWE